MDCDFESNVLCNVSHDSAASDTWAHVYSFEASEPPVDNTLNSGQVMTSRLNFLIRLLCDLDRPFSEIPGRGAYIYMLKSANRPGYTARMYTDYYNTSGRCITFAYSIFGEADSFIRVRSIREDKSESLSDVLQSDWFDFDYSVEWHQYRNELPDGINMVVIEGVRGDLGSSGMAIDDLLIDRCEKLEGK